MSKYKYTPTFKPTSKRYKKDAGCFCPICGDSLNDFANKGFPDKIPNSNGGFMNGMFRKLVTWHTCKSTWYEEWAIIGMSQLKRGDTIGKKER